MKVLSTSQGVFLVFPSLADLERTIVDLMNHAERAVREEAQAPYVYVRTDEIDPEKIRPTIDEIKRMEKTHFFGIDQEASERVKEIIAAIDSWGQQLHEAFKP